jgi:branched-chain amino acid transport system substrate-binding protein
MLTAGVYSSTLHYFKALQAAGTDEPKAVMAKMREMPSLPVARQIADAFVRRLELGPDVVRDSDLGLGLVAPPPALAVL